jgi:glycosyltransferase involved in cell wall biosynthesis
MHSHADIKKVAFIGNYLPRKCGIATFTTSLCESLTNHFPEIQTLAVPVTDIDEGYMYPDKVRFEIREQDPDSYERAADFLSNNDVDIACLQHEFGIYGGTAGDHILILLRKLKMPVVTTLHTILAEPDKHQRKVMEQLINLSDRIVVMTRKATEILQSMYRVGSEKVVLIPHGILDIPFVDPNFYKDLFGVEGKIVILTFGLLSPDKGVEYVIKALPAVLKEHADTVYIILGATHPNIFRYEGEGYRLKIQSMAEDLGIAENVLLYNRFVSTEELKEYIGAADIYITPYLKESQISSGTLAYSYGAGKAVISTPYWHAEELLSKGRGILVPFKNSDSIAQSILFLIKNETKRHAIRKMAYLSSRDMVWTSVAKLYKKTFEDSRKLRLKFDKNIHYKKILESHQLQLPGIKLEHLFKITDSTGIFNKSLYNVPHFVSGYLTIDNARALILTVLLENTGYIPNNKISKLASTYLSFLCFAFNDAPNRFRSQLSFSREWLDSTPEEVCHAQALWALGTCIGRSSFEGFRGIAGHLFETALAECLQFTIPLAWAFTLLGIHEYFRRYDGDLFVNNCRELLAEKLLIFFKQNSRPEIPWFSIHLHKSNAKLSHALILSGRWLNNPDMLNTGLESLRYLFTLQSSPKGCFYSLQNINLQTQEPKENTVQYPIETGEMISAALEAYRTTQDLFWYNAARQTFEWFMGKNDIAQPLYDSKTGGCKDAIDVDRIIPNESAEATLSFYLSLIEMQSMENIVARFREPITT